MKKVKVIFSDGSTADINEADLPQALANGARRADSAGQEKSTTMVFKDGSSADIAAKDMNGAISAGAVKKNNGENGTGAGSNGTGVKPVAPVNVTPPPVVTETPQPDVFPTRDNPLPFPLGQPAATPDIKNAPTPPAYTGADVFPTKDNAIPVLPKEEAPALITTPDGLAFPVKKDRPIGNAYLNSPLALAALQIRVANKTTNDQDAQTLSDISGISLQATQAYLTKGRDAGSAVEITENAEKTNQTIVNGIEAGITGTGYDPHEVLASADKSSEALLSVKKDQEAEVQRQQHYQDQVRAAENSPGAATRFMPAPIAPTDPEVIKKSNDLQEALTYNIRKLTADETIAKGLSPAEAADLLFKRLDPAGYAKNQELRKPREQSPVQSMEFINRTADFIANKVSNRDVLNREALNAEKSQYELQLNRGMKDLATELMAKGITENNQTIISQAASILPHIQDDNAIIEKYPMLMKQKMAQYINDRFAKEAGIMEGTEAEGSNGRMLGAVGINSDVAKRYLREGGFYDKPAYKDYADDVATHQNTYLADNSTFGGVGMSFLKPFVSLFNTVGDITGVRTPTDIHAENLREQMFPARLSEGVKNLVSFKLGGHQFDINTSNTLNSIANLGGYMAIAAGTSGVGTELGASAKIAERTASWASFGIGSVDDGLKEADKMGLTPAQSWIYASLKGVMMAEGGRVFEFGHVKVPEIPGVNAAIAKVAIGMSDKTIAEQAAKEQLQGVTNKWMIGLKKYAIGTAKGAGVMSAFGIGDSMLRIGFGDKTVNPDDIIPEAANAYLSGLLTMGFFGAFGLKENIENAKNSTYKGMITKFADNPDATHDALTIGLNQGLFSQEEFNQKVAILNTATAAKAAFNETVAQTKVKVTPDQRAVWIANKTAESILRLQAAGKNVSEEDAKKYTDQANNLQRESAKTLDGLTFTKFLEPKYDLYNAVKEHQEALSAYTQIPTKENEKIVLDKKEALEKIQAAPLDDVSKVFKEINEAHAEIEKNRQQDLHTFDGREPKGGFTVDGIRYNSLNDYKDQINDKYDNELRQAGNAKPVIPAPDKLKAAIAILPEKHPALMGMDEEQSIKLIAQQAQNVSHDGKDVSVNSDGSKADGYKSAVNAFTQPLVDAAIEAHPRESLLTSEPKKAEGIISGNDVYENYLQHGSDHNSDNLSDIEDAVKSKDFKLAKVPIDKLIENDPDLKDHLKNDKPLRNKRAVEHPIIVGDVSRGGPISKDGVIDGFHRIAQALANGETEVNAYVQSDSKLLEPKPEPKLTAAQEKAKNTFGKKGVTPAQPEEALSLKEQLANVKRQQGQPSEKGNISKEAGPVLRSDTGVRKLANDEAALSESEKQKIQALRLERDNRIGELEKQLRAISERYGGKTDPKTFTGEDRQQWELLQRELQVGVSERAKQESVSNIPGNVPGQNDSGKGFSGNSGGNNRPSAESNIGEGNDSGRSSGVGSKEGNTGIQGGSAESNAVGGKEGNDEKGIKEPDKKILTQTGNGDANIPQSKSNEKLPYPTEEEFNNGVTPSSQLDADKRFSNGERIFAIPEMDEQPIEITSADVLKNYTADQLIALPAKDEQSKYEGYLKEFNQLKSNEQAGKYQTPGAEKEFMDFAQKLLDDPKIGKSIKNFGKDAYDIVSNIISRGEVEGTIKGQIINEKEKAEKSNKAENHGQLKAENSAIEKWLDNSDHSDYISYDWDGKNLEIFKSRDQAPVELSRKELIDEGVDFPEETPTTQIGGKVPETKKTKTPPPKEKPATPPKAARRTIRDEKVKKEIDDAWDDFLKGDDLLTSGGLDPKKIEAGTKLIGLYLKAGKYKFADILEDAYAKFGEKLHDFVDALKSVYSTHFNTTATDEEAAKMDPSVRDIKLQDIIDKVNKENSTENPKTNVSNPREPPAPHSVESTRTFVDRFKDKLNNNEKLNIVGLRKLAEEAGIKNPKDTELQEMAELGITEMAREISLSPRSSEERFKDIVDLYNKQPTISMRSSERIDKQQYSTPIPIGFMMGEYLNQGNPETYLEPSTGNGMLTVNIPPEKTIANEIDPVRLKMLGEQGFRMVTNQDANKPFPYKVDRVLMNPPFGKSEAKEFDGAMISGLDEQMVANALTNLNEDGKGAIVIGGHNSYDEKGRLKNDKYFFNYLYKRYHVDDVINIDGSLYSKQGTSFPVRVILIGGVKKDKSGYAPLEDKEANKPVKSFEELQTRIQNIIDNGPAKHNIQPDLDAQAKPGDAIHGGSPAGGKSDGQGTPAGTRTNQDQFLADTKQANEGKTPPDDRGLITDLSGAIRNGERQFDTDNNGNGALDESGNPIQEGPKGPGATDQGGRTGELQGSHPLPISDRTISILDEKAPYVPKSGGKSVDTVMPSQMATETYHTLDEIEKIYGNIDDFVSGELGYKGKDDLHKAMSAEQVDGLAIAIHQLKNGQGAIIGDMTGVGKGRIAAGVIRYAIKNGFKPLFLTEKTNLFSDLYRDMVDIGSGHLVPFIVNDKRKDDDPSIVDADGNIIHKSFGGNPKKNILLAGSIPKGYDFTVATYSQFRTDPSTPSMKRDFFYKNTPGNIIIMDESHNASGESNAGTLFQGVLPETKGVIFLSATFAKRSNNMPVYAMKTAMQDANMTTDELVAAIDKGGTALQEVVAAELVQSGQMIRRERDFTDVKKEFKILHEQAEDHTKTADSLTAVVRDVIEFEKRHIEPVLNGIDDEMVAQQGSVKKRPGTKAAGVGNVPFASKTFNLVNQMLFSIKAKELALHAVELHKEGKKPVIGFNSTMESFLNSIGVVPGEKLDKADFALVMKRALEGTLKYMVYDGTSKKGKPASLSLSELTPEGRQRYNEIVNNIRGVTSGISISPIDTMIKILQDAGLRVGEITGRNKMLEFHNDGSATVKLRTDKNINKTSRDFNNGDLDVILLNASGATGISLHSSSKFKDQRQRVLISGQMELDINKEVQKRGRVDRTGQVLRAMFHYVVSAIPAEQRLLMMFKSKLKSLDANTTSSQKSKANEMDTVDFLNKYGDEVVTQYAKENLEFNDRIQDPLHFNGKSDDEIADIKTVENAASKVTGRVAILPVKEQEAFYKDIIEAYTSHMDYLKDNNENDLEVKLLPLNAETKSSQEVIAGRGTDSPFGMPSTREKIEVDVLTKPLKKAEIDEEITRTLDGKTPKESSDNLVKELDTYQGDFIAKKIQKIEDNYNKEIIPDVLARAQKKNPDITTDQLQVMKNDLIAAKEKKQARERAKYDNVFGNVENVINSFKPGDVFSIPVSTRIDTNTFFSNGVFMGFHIRESNTNKFTPSNIVMRFAVNDSRRVVSVPVSKTDFINSIIVQSRYIKDKTATRNDWDSKISNKTRADRYMITGNLLQAYGTNDGQLVAYTTKDGHIKKGMLLPDSYEADKQKFRTSVSQAYRDSPVNKIVSTDKEVTLEKERGGAMTITVPLSKQRGGKYFLDPTLRSLVDGGGFHQSGQKMEAHVYEKNIPAVLLALDKMGVTVDSDIAKPGMDRDRPKFSIKDAGDPEMEAKAQAIKEYIDSGVTELRDIQQDVADNSGNHTPELKQEVKEAYEYYHSKYIPQEIHSAVVDRIKEGLGHLLGQGIQVYKNGNEVLKAAAQFDEPEFMLDPKGEVLGFTAPDGSIHLNGEKLNGNTPVHEAGHVWLKWAEQYRPDLHKTGMDLMVKSNGTDTNYLKEIRANQDYIDLADSQGLKGKVREDFFRNEALASAIGDQGEKFISESRRNTFKEWLSNLWDGLKKHFGIRDLSAKEISKLTLDEFSKKVAADILSGKPLETGAEEGAGEGGGTGGNEPPPDTDTAEGRKREGIGLSQQEVFDRYGIRFKKSPIPWDETARKGLDRLREEAFRKSTSIKSEAKYMVDLMSRESAAGRLSVSPDRVIAVATHLMDVEESIDNLNQMKATTPEERSDLAAQLELAEFERGKTLFVNSKMGTVSGRTLRLYAGIFSRENDGGIKIWRRRMEGMFGVELPETVKELDRIPAVNMSTETKDKVRPYVRRLEEIKKEYDDAVARFEADRKQFAADDIANREAIIRQHQDTIDQLNEAHAQASEAEREAASVQIQKLMDQIKEHEDTIAELKKNPTVDSAAEARKKASDQVRAFANKIRNSKSLDDLGLGKRKGGGQTAGFSINIKENLADAMDFIADQIEKIENLDIGKAIADAARRFKGTNNQDEFHGLLKMAWYGNKEIDKSLKKGPVPFNVKADAADEAEEHQRLKTLGQLTQLSRLAEKANEKWYDKGFAVRRAFLIGGLKTMGRVTVSGVSKYLIDPIVKQGPANWFSNLPGLGKEKASLKAMGEGFADIIKFSSDRQALRYVSAKQKMFEKASSALAKSDRILARFGEENNPAAYEKYELTKHREIVQQYQKAELESAKAGIYKWIHGSQLSDVSDLFKYGSTPFEQAMGGYTMSNIKDLKGVDKFIYVLDAMARLHGIEKNPSARRALIETYNYKLENYQKEGIPLTASTRMRALTMAWGEYLDGKYQKGNELVDVINRTKFPQPYPGKTKVGALRLAAAIYTKAALPVAKVTTNILKLGFDMSTVGLEGVIRYYRAVNTGIRENQAEGKTYHGLWDKLLAGAENIPEEDRLKITKLMGRGLVGLGLMAYAAYGVTHGSIQYGGEYDENHKAKRKYLDKDGHWQELDYGQWVLGGWHAGKFWSGVFNHLPEFMPIAMIVNSHNVYVYEHEYPGKEHRREKKGVIASFNEVFWSDLNEILERTPYPALVHPGKLLESLISLPIAKDVSEYMDQDAQGNLIPRPAENPFEKIELNTGFRKFVPTKPKYQP